MSFREELVKICLAEMLKWDIKDPQDIAPSVVFTADSVIEKMKQTSKNEIESTPKFYNCEHGVPQTAYCSRCLKNVQCEDIT